MRGGGGDGGGRVQRQFREHVAQHLVHASSYPHQGEPRQITHVQSPPIQSRHVMSSTHCGGGGGGGDSGGSGGEIGGAGGEGGPAAGVVAPAAWKTVAQLAVAPAQAGELAVDIPSA